MRYYLPMLALLLGLSLSVYAGEADVLKVDVNREGDNYVFEVTVKHQDEGWSHYADRWEVLGAEDSVLASRVLYHPHVHEQPFTRSLSGVKLPTGLYQVQVRAHDSVHGYGGQTIKVLLPEK